MDGEPLISRFVEDLNQVLDRYRDQGLTVAEAVGGLELVKLQVAAAALDQDDEPQEPSP